MDPIEMTVESFEEIPAPSDAYRGKQLFVKAGAGVADFIGFGRKNAADVNQWFPLEDRFQAEVASLQALTNLGAADFRFGNTFSVDLTDYDSVMFRLRCTVAGVTGRVRLQYTIDSASFFDLSAEFVSLATTGIKEVVWDDIPSGAKGPVILIGTAYNGNGTEDPTIITFVAHFRR